MTFHKSHIKLFKIVFLRFLPRSMVIATALGIIFNYIKSKDFRYALYPALHLDIGSSHSPLPLSLGVKTFIDGWNFLGKRAKCTSCLVG